MSCSLKWPNLFSDGWGTSVATNVVFHAMARPKIPGMAGSDISDTAGRKTRRRRRIQAIHFAIFKPLSYCFEETIGFDVKTSFASRPVSFLIRWYNKPGETTKSFEKRLFSSTVLYMDWKLQSELQSVMRFTQTQ